MKTTEMQHTPTPWKVFVSGTSPAAVAIGRPMSEAFLCHVSGDLPQARANATFIVRAVNAHEDLYIRLKTMSWAFHQNGKHPGQFSECDSDVCQENKAAISKASGSPR